MTVMPSVSSETLPGQRGIRQRRGPSRDLLRLGVALLAGGLLTSCHIFGPEHQLARVEAIEAPASIPPSTPLTIRLVGRIGGDGCSSFDRIDIDRDLHRIEFSVWTTRVDGVCTLQPVPLDRTITLRPPFGDPLELFAYSRDTEPVSVQVRIHVPFTGAVRSASPAGVQR